MTLRKIFFWMHLTAGTVAGIVVLLMSITGVLLAYEKQIIAWVDRDLRSIQHPATANRLPVESLLSAVREARNAVPSTLTLRADPNAAAEAGFGRESVVFVNPYTGVVLGGGSQKARSFFAATTEVHRWLAMKGDRRATGRAITGASNLLFLFLVCSGFYLWFPRKWTWKHIKPVFLFRGGLAAKARDFNWHNVIGVWSAVPLFFIVLTGVVMSYPWANNLLYRLTNSEPPTQQGRRGENPPGEVSFEGVDAIWAKAEQQVTGWQSISVPMPHSNRGPLTFSIDQGAGGRPDLRGQFTFNRKTGDLVRAETFSSFNLGRRLRTWARFVHTGEAGGLPGQTIAAVVSAGGAVLVWTGLALALRRLQAWRKRKRATQEILVARDLKVEAIQ